MLMSALAGMLAVSVVAAAFWWIRCDMTQVVPCALPAKSMRCQADDSWHHLPAVLLLCCKLCRGLTPCRRNRLQTVPGQLGYEPLRDSNEGMSPAQMRALPVVMHEKRHSSFGRHDSE